MVPGEFKGPVRVDCAYPGGNVVVEELDGDRLVVRPDLRDTSEWWFWWNFRVRGAAGRTLRVEFPGERGPVGPNGAATSLDGRRWRWLPGEFSPSHFVAEVPAGAGEIYFAFSFPYQLADWQRFTAGLGVRPEVRLTELAATAAGRVAPLLVIGDPERAGSNVLLACRHHACEAMASFLLEGIVEEVLAPGSAGLRAATAFTVAPFMDLDGVEAGDQGKARRPHDHNRDYLDAPLYPAVRAMQEVVRRLAGRNLVAYADLHCPWIRSGRNQSVFLVEPPPPWAAEVARFREVLARTPTGPVRYTGAQDIPCGVEWNSGDAPTSQRFVREHGGPGLRLVMGVEFSYSLAEGTAVTPESARLFGRGFARALAEYLGSPTTARP